MTKKSSAARRKAPTSQNRGKSAGGKGQPIALLRPDAKNARQITRDALEGLGASMKEFGDLAGITWNEKLGDLVAGHQRMKKLRANGARSWERTGDAGVVTDPKTGERFPVRIVRWDETKHRLAQIAANNPVIQGTFAAETIEQLRALETDARYAELRLADLAAQLKGESDAGEAPGPAEGENDVPEPPKTPVSRPGDIWILGDHRLMCGDSTSAESVVRLMGGARAHLMATDPPYGVDFSGAKYNPRAKEWAGIANDKLQGDDLKSFLLAMLRAWLPHVEEEAGFYFWTAAMQEGAAAAAAAAAIRETGLHIQSQIIWNKNALVLGQADYQWKHENCWYAFWKGKHHRWLGERDKTTVWEVSKVAHSEYVHPMQKPVELYEIPQLHHTKSGEAVVEPFSGSGSQIIAAEKLGRRCYAMELEPTYVDVAVARWEKFTGKKAIRQAAARQPKKRTMPPATEASGG
jgi:DNA modification methylase